MNYYYLLVVGLAHTHTLWLASYISVLPVKNISSCASQQLVSIIQLISIHSLSIRSSTPLLMLSLYLSLQFVAPDSLPQPVLRIQSELAL